MCIKKVSQMLKLVIIDSLNQKHVSIRINNVEESRSWFKDEQILLPIESKVVGLGDDLQTYIIDSIAINLAHVVTMQWFHEQ